MSQEIILSTRSLQKGVTNNARLDENQAREVILVVAR